MPETYVPWWEKITAAEMASAELRFGSPSLTLNPTAGLALPVVKFKRLREPGTPVRLPAKAQRKKHARHDKRRSG